MSQYKLDLKNTKYNIKKLKTPIAIIFSNVLFTFTNFKTNKMLLLLALANFGFYDVKSTTAVFCGARIYFFTTESSVIGNSKLISNVFSILVFKRTITFSLTEDSYLP